MGIRDNRYTVDVPTVTGPVSRPQPVHLDEVGFSRAQTDRRLKFTLPGPMTICDTIANAHYATRADMAMAFADILNTEARELEAVGIDLIQLDEPAFNVFMDDVKEWGIDALHRAIAGMSCTTAVHQLRHGDHPLRHGPGQDPQLGCRRGPGAKYPVR